MSEGADNTQPPGARPVAGSGGSGGGEDSAGGGTGGTGGLLVVVEPPNQGSGAAGTGGSILVAEGARLARESGVVPHFVTWPTGAEANVELLAATLAEAIDRRRPLAALLADTDVGRQLAPMVAYRLDSGAIVGCSDVIVRDGALTFVKPVFGDWLEREIEPAIGVIPVATLDLSGMDEPGSPPAGLPAPEMLEIEPSAHPRVRRLQIIPPDARSVDLVHARRIVAAGAGSVSDDLLAAVGELAELLEGSVGTTRPVVDDGRVPKERLIGQTGKSVTPDLYIALGISGSPHHMAGVRGADRILSVNRDVRAPIFQFSDIGYVADLELVLPGLVNKIKEWRGASESPQ